MLTGLTTFRSDYTVGHANYDRSLLPAEAKKRIPIVEADSYCSLVLKGEDHA